MTPIATLKTNPTPELISKILARAAADGADAVVIHLPQISEDEICFLYLLVPELSPRLDAQERSYVRPCGLTLDAQSCLSRDVCTLSLKGRRVFTNTEKITNISHIEQTTLLLMYSASALTTKTLFQKIV